MMIHTGLGLGAYPTDSYYDPNRPSWVPYWLDTPTESAMKYGAYGQANVNTEYPLPPTPLPPPVPTGADTGSVLGPNAVEEVVTGSASRNRQQAIDFFNEVEGGLPDSTKHQSLGAAWVYIGLGLLLYAVLVRR